MDAKKIQFVAGILFAIGIGVALAASLDNIPLGAGAGILFGLAFQLRRQKKINNQQ